MNNEYRVEYGGNTFSISGSDMDDTILTFAASWWAQRFSIIDKQQDFYQALCKILRDNQNIDWILKTDYDPHGLLLEAVRKSVACRGFLFSCDNSLPTKTIMKRVGNCLEVKEGYGSDWYKISFSEIPNDKKGEQYHVCYI